MKKDKLLKTLFISFLVISLFTWIIPVGSISEGGFTKDSTNPLGFFDLVRVPFITISNFVHLGILILVIGGFYGVLNKTGVYSKLVNRLSEKYKDKFLFISTIFFILAASLIGENALLLVLVPFFGAVLLKQNYSKITTLTATIGAVLVGNIGNTFGSTITASFKYFYGIDYKTELFTKFMFLFIVSFLYIMSFIHKKEPVKTKKESKDIPLLVEEKTNDKKVWPLVVVVISVFIFLVLAMYKWYFVFEISTFEDINKTLSELTVGNYPLVKNFLGAYNTFGNWTEYDLIMILAIISAVVTWLYSIKFKDAVDAFVEGAKSVGKVAFYVIMANLILAIFTLVQGSSANIFLTISHGLANISSSISLVAAYITSLFGSIFFNDFLQYSQNMRVVVSAFYSNSLYLPVISLIVQFVHGILMMILPTSILLVTGLTYFDIKYQEWLGYIWKYIVKITFVSIIIITVVRVFM